MIRRTKVAKSNDVKITFSLPNDQLNGNISVVGDFNDWRPGEHVMAKRANGTRSIAITVLVIPAARSINHHVVRHRVAPVRRGSP